MNRFRMMPAKEANEFFEANGSDYRVQPGASLTMADLVAIQEVILRKEMVKMGYKFSEIKKRAE